MKRQFNIKTVTSTRVIFTNNLLAPPGLKCVLATKIELSAERCINTRQIIAVIKVKCKKINKPITTGYHLLMFFIVNIANTINPILELFYLKHFHDI